MGKPFQSIKSRVTLFVVAMLATSIAGTSWLLVHRAESDTLVAVRDRELRDGARTASILSRRVVDLQRALSRTAALLDPATLSDPARLNGFIETKPVLRGLFSNVYVANLQGDVLVVSEPGSLRHPQLNIADRDYFRSTLSEGRPIVSEPLPSKLSNEPLVVFTAPLRHGGEVHGVIAGAMRLTHRDLLSDLVEESDSDSEVMLVVTDAKGRILAHPSPERIMQSIATEPRMAEGYAAWLSAGGASGGAVEPAGLFLQQPGQVLAVAGVPGPDWLVWRAVPESSLLAPIHAARRETFMWAILIVAGASIIVLVAMASMLRPLSQLKARAVTLFDGTNAMHDGWPTVGGEIGELARVLRHVGAERAQLEQFNQSVMAKLNSVMAAAPLGILFTRARRFELVSAEFCRLLGRTEDQLLGHEVRFIFAASEDYDALGHAVGAAFATGQPYIGEWRFRKADGSDFWGQLRGMPVEAGKAASGTIWTLADIEDQVAAREALRWSASHDALTGLGNRKLFEQQATKLMQARPESLPAALVMIDLDRFKPVNDTAGHAAGDAMLKLVASAITSKIRGSDLAVRLGGDEFAILLQNCPPEAALRVAENVRTAIADKVLTWGGHELRVGASLGVTPLADSTASLSDWLQAADAACYEAKAAGRDKVRGSEVRHLRAV